MPTTNKGYLINAPIRPISPDDTYPVALANELKGGCHSAITREQMESIPLERRQEGMLCTVGSSVFQLLDNEWVPLTIASDTNEVIDDFNSPYSSKGYLHTQMHPSKTWIIPHDLNKLFPNVICVDCAGEEIIGEIVYKSETSTIVKFNIHISGRAYLE